MRNQPTPYRSAAEVRDRALALFALADQQLTAAMLGPGVVPKDDLWEDAWGTNPYQRAAAIAAVAAAGARVAHAMTGAEHVALAKEETVRVERRTEGLTAVLRDLGTTDDEVPPADGAEPAPAARRPWFVLEPVTGTDPDGRALGRVRFLRPGLYEVDVDDAGIARVSLASEGDPLAVDADYRREDGADGS